MQCQTHERKEGGRQTPEASVQQHGGLQLVPAFPYYRITILLIKKMEDYNSMKSIPGDFPADCYEGQKKQKHSLEVPTRSGFLPTFSSHDPSPFTLKDSVLQVFLQGLPQASTVVGAMHRGLSCNSCSSTSCIKGSWLRRQEEAQIHITLC